MTSAIPERTLFDARIPWNAVYRKRMVMLVMTTHADWFRDGDLDYVARNYHVWEAFEREANRVWESGRRHYSARTIGEYLRHESALRQEEPDEDFKLNNNIYPSLARIYMAMHPERFGFFERRPGGSAVRAL